MGSSGDSDEMRCCSEGDLVAVWYDIVVHKLAREQNVYVSLSRCASTQVPHTAFVSEISTASHGAHTC